MFFSGVSTALITPFKKGAIDYKSLKKLLQFQIESGIQGIVVAGSTGEAATLSLEEKCRLLDYVLTEVSGEVPVIMGCGSFNTKETMAWAKEFKKRKPQGLLVVTPYYNKPPQRGLVEHFKKVASATNLKIILYNVPGRTSVNMSPQTVLEIVKASKNICGIKEAAGSLPVVDELISTLPKTQTVLSGDDETFLQAIAAGAHGVISVISNIIPEWCVSVAAKTSQTKQAEASDVERAKLFSKFMFCESNPIPVKYALQKMGVIASDELRLPLVTLDKCLRPGMDKFLKEAGCK